MKTRLLMLVLGITLSTGVAAIFSAQVTYAACECACAWGCGNHCNAELTNCGFLEGLEAAAACCREAHELVGDTEPCPD